MRKLFTLFFLSSMLFSTVAFAQCSKEYKSVDIDSIFSCWQKRIQSAAAGDSVLKGYSSFDTVFQIGDSTTGFGQFRIRMGENLGGMNFSFDGMDTFGLENDFFPDLFGGRSPFNINFGFDNMFRQLEELFKDFDGIDVIPPRMEPPPSKKPTYRI
jgi:hypothetical protein